MEEVVTNVAQICDILFEWDDEGEGTCTKNGFRRAVQAVAASGKLTSSFTREDLDALFDCAVSIAGQSNATLIIGELPELLKVALGTLAARKGTAAGRGALTSAEADVFDGLLDKCGACGAEASEGKKLALCQRCKCVRYCGRECQIAGWKAGHKDSCGKVILGPNAVRNAGASQVVSALSEFAVGRPVVAEAYCKRLAQLTLDPTTYTEVFSQLIANQNAVKALMKVMEQNVKCVEIFRPAYMVLCALCMSPEGKYGYVIVELDLLKEFIGFVKKMKYEGQLLVTGLSALRGLANGGPTAKEALIQSGTSAVVVDALDLYQDEPEPLLQGFAVLGNITHRTGLKGRKTVIWGHGIQMVVRAMRKHAEHEQLQQFGAKALRNFIAGDETGMVCGEASVIAHVCVDGMVRFLGIETLADAMVNFPENSEIQEDACAVFANLGSIDVASKRANGVQPGWKDTSTQATKNLIEVLPVIVSAVKKFPSLGSPRHALHVITATSGTPEHALEAGADEEMLPPKLLIKPPPQLKKLPPQLK
eukprot:CAMPEP_0119324990 /NCGR_PEP_ID=MMETSP1333-20130426/64651_1 /TAXON_ID=418940 /ORGANISM="Scyphosphaera apsteinii, Strain RCC1455" /LENGTH=534 /DNA_ID=CAMNT_0007332835 /DNA_START=8 /DNA_END=1612 /DNA_ORIENTATION=+